MIMILQRLQGDWYVHFFCIRVGFICIALNSYPYSVYIAVVSCENAF